MIYTFVIFIVHLLVVIKIKRQVSLFTYLKRLRALQFYEKVRTFDLFQNKTFTRPDPSLCEINEITLVDQQSHETLAGESSFTSASDNRSVYFQR